MAFAVAVLEHPNTSTTETEQTPQGFAPQQILWDG